MAIRVTYQAAGLHAVLILADFTLHDVTCRAAAAEIQVTAGITAGMQLLQL